MRYQILKASSISGLESEVSDWINLGWKPCGTMTATKVNTDPGFFGENDIESEYCQPMTKDD